MTSVTPLPYLFRTNYMSYKCFSNKDCQYFPCHAETEGKEFNCMFCYCPLYALGTECGGDFQYTASGIKDCSYCTLPHQGEDGWEHIHRNIGKLLDKVRNKNNRPDNNKEIC